VLHDLLSQHQRFIDITIFSLTGVTVGTLLSEVAFVVTILAGLASLTLALIRIHDRIRYGRAGE